MQTLERQLKESKESNAERSQSTTSVDKLDDLTVIQMKELQEELKLESDRDFQRERSAGRPSCNNSLQCCSKN